MADDISSILTSIGSQSKNIDQLTKSLEKLATVKKDAFSSGDVSSILAFSKMEKAIKRLMVATDKYTDSQNELKKAQEEGKELTEEQIQALNEVQKEYNESTRIVKDFQKVAVDAHDKIRQKVEQTKKETTEYWKEHTQLGKAWEHSTQGLAKLTAGLTFTGLAFKALERHARATELRQNILIQSYQGLNTTLKNTNGGITAQNMGFRESAKAIADVTLDAQNYDVALAKAEATAVRMGVSTDEVGKGMERFSKITGVTNPAALGKLTEGAMTVSRAMGITTAEAIDFVALRMDKFGGSAAGAIVALNQIRVDTERTNNEFGRTVIRADDVVKTLSDISRQTNMYAIDQRFVGNILRDNIAKLQSAGDSYESAQRKATAYTKAVTGQAPEWMQVYSGIDIIGQLTEGFDGKTLSDELGKELNAAKPGLREEVEKVMGDKSMGYYSKMRLVQELTSGTTLGVEAMNKQILKLASNPQGIELIASQFGVTRAEAAGMVTQAKDAAAATALLGSRIEMNAEQLAESLEIEQDEAEMIIKNNESMADRKRAIKEITDLQSREKTAQDDMDRLDAQDKANKHAKKLIQDKIQMYQKFLAEAEDEGDETKIKHAKKLIEQSQAELSRYERKEKEGDLETEGLKTVEDINKELLKQFQGYSVNTGKEFQAMITEMTTIKTLLMGAVIAGALRYLLKYTGAIPRIEALLAKRSILGKGGAGGAAGGTGKQGDEIAEELGDALKEKESKKSKTKEEKAEEKKAKAEEKRRLKEEAKHAPKKSFKERMTGAGKGIGGKLKGVGSYLSTFDATPIESSLGKTASKFATAGAMASIALKLAGDTFGDVLETSSGDLKKIDESWVGSASNLASSLSLVPGPVGQLAQVFEASVLAGKLANKGLDALGITSEKCGDGLMWLADKTGPFGKAMAWMAGGETKKSFGETDKELLKGDMGRKAIEKSSSKWGMTPEEFTDAIQKASEKKMKVADYLESQGRKRTEAAASSKVSTPSAIQQASMTKQEAVKLVKETKSVNAPISTATKAALNVAQTTTPDASKTASDAKLAQDAGQPTSLDQTATGTTTGDQGPMSGSFVGGLQGDGSVMLKVDNFMKVFAQAQTRVKNGTQRPAG